MDVQPITLTGRVVRVTPLNESHAEALARHADADLLKYTFFPAGMTVDECRAYIRKILEQPAFIPFAIQHLESGDTIGMTSYMDIRPAHRGLEIGSTWFAAAYHGTLVNPEMKYMMLRHAFENLGAIRVQLKTDARNIHSQNAIAKLGAVREGVLRKQYVMPDGYLRDSVMYSITDDEWAEVKARLEARLGYVP